jgi:hypothetical protein
MWLVLCRRLIPYREEERMKKIALVLILLLMIGLTLVNVPHVSTTEDLHVTWGLPQDIPSEPSDSPTDDYLNTTNPYTDTPGIEASSEIDEIEGNKPLYVLVFGDEEERETTRYLHYPLTWEMWAELQIERGDEALVANFGIDIRILGFEEWDSDDDLDNMYDLWYELESDTKQYLRQWYSGESWSNYVDAIIGITSQVDPYPVAGLSPSPELLDQGKIVTLLNWQVYWADDNLVQHEVSHLYYADDHYATCCVMAYHTHYQTWIWEDGLWWVFNDVRCAYTTYEWCTDCHEVIQGNSDRYPIRTLTISASSSGTTDPDPGTYAYSYGSSVTVTASASSGYAFDYWILDGAPKYDNPITVTMNSDHTLKAYFSYTGGVGGCPILSVYDGNEYVEEGLLDIHNPDGADVVTSHVFIHTPEPVEDRYLMRLTEHPQTHSHIDQEQLFATLENGMEIKLPLVSAVHSADGDVLHKLRVSDDVRADTLGADHNNGTSEYINLEFVAPDGLEIETFTFIIEGHNMVFKK